MLWKILIKKCKPPHTAGKSLICFVFSVQENKDTNTALSAIVSNHLKSPILLFKTCPCGIDVQICSLMNAYPPNFCPSLAILGLYWNAELLVLMHTMVQT